MKLFKVAFGAAGLLMATGATAQYAYSEPMYYITYYSDATHTEEVGYAAPDCRGYYVTYEYHGQQTQFSREDRIGRCTESGPVLEPTT